MTVESVPADIPAVLDQSQLDALFSLLIRLGYRLIGPRRDETAIVYEEVNSVSDLPRGWTEVQAAGQYRLERRTDEALFGFGTVAHSWKRYLNPPRQRLWQAYLGDGTSKGMEIEDEPIASEKLALIGVRPCDLRAIAAQDRVFLEGPYVDPGYKSRRENLFILAVNCTAPGGNCFCTSMGTGPKAESGYDLVLTEVLTQGRHFLLARSGTEAGASVLAQVPHAAADRAELEASERPIERAIELVPRRLAIEGLKDVLSRSYENPMWEQVAARCLACGNCTMVCPTCFCSTVEDVTDLSGGRAERWRKWDTCFNLDFSYIHGGSIRTSIYSRYRQWLMHKLATWSDQFGEPGCVGCGRCITWCPVGIDLTEQARAIRASAATA